VGAARVMEWTRPSDAICARKPSWLAPPPSKAPESRPRLSVVPAPRLASVAPPPSGPVVNEAAPISMAPRWELEERDETIRELNAELETLRATAAGLAATLATAEKRMLEASEGELVKLAIVIAERVVGIATAADPALIAGWARDAIAALPAREVMVVAISSDLAASVPESTWAIATDGMHRLEVDKTLPPATCEIRAGVASVEVSAAARMAAVGEAIGAIT
jgi:flagellar biosynthesis/type III secretory pathway protein FliH